MKNLTYLICLLCIACGKGPEVKNRVSNSAVPDFNTSVCGDIIPPTQNSLATGQFYHVSNKSGKYLIQPQSEYVANSLNNLNDYENICLFSHDDILDGNVIKADQIKIKVENKL